jgi:hypothetical protein
MTTAASGPDRTLEVQPVHAPASPSRAATWSRRIRYAIALLLGTAVAAMGYVTSFSNLSKWAQAHHYSIPAALPIGLDIGIPALLILDSLRPSRYLRWSAWALSALTVAGNAAVTPGASVLDRALHGVMPAVAILFFEALRHLRVDQSKDKTRAELDRIRRSRYVVAPVRTIRLRVRMIAWEVTSYTEALRLESTILYARAVLIAEYGKRSWVGTRRRVPIILAHQLATGQLPQHLMFETDWQRAVRDWVVSTLDELDPTRGAEPGKPKKSKPVSDAVPEVVIQREPWDRVWDRRGESVPDGLTPDQISMAYGLARQRFEQIGRHISGDLLSGPIGIGKPKALALAKAFKTAYETEVNPRFSQRSHEPGAELSATAPAETGPEPAETAGFNSGPVSAHTDV